MPVFNKFHYEPLSAESAIRLIVLPRATNYWSPLTCEIIEERQPAQHPGYSCVSYAWGERQFSRTLEVKHDGDVSYLRVTPTVDTMLRHLRKPNKLRYLWIDAISLNQEDEMEKAHQIPNMGTIFKTALEVDIWVGDDAPMTAKLFTFFRHLSQIPDVTHWKRQWDMAGQIVNHMRQFLHHDNGVSLGIISDFFNRPWFSRRWIIQEACLSRQAMVHCGSHTIPLKTLSVAAKRFQRLDMSDYAIKMTANLDGMTTQSSMLELLWNFHEAICLEPKDRIVALLSMVPSDQRFRLDYMKHWTETFKDFASFTYRTGSNDVRLQLLLHLFEFGPVSRQTDASYPSWVPDWTQTRRRSLPYLAYPRNPDTYEAYPHSPGYSDEKAVLTFQSNSLRIHWDPSRDRAQEYRVAFSATMETHHSTRESGLEQVLKTLYRLFPSVSDAAHGIIALASLLKRVSEFRQPPAEREESARSLGIFEIEVNEYHSHLDTEELFKWLQMLERTLEDFSVVELVSPGQKSTAGRNYGIGPKQMAVDDVVLPLWGLKKSPYGTGPMSDAATHGFGVDFRVMLALRRVKKQMSYIFDEGDAAQAAQVIGPVIVVTSSGKSDGEGDDAPGMDENERTDVEGWLSVRLI